MADNGSGSPLRIPFDPLLSPNSDLWSQLPAGLAEVFRPGVPDLIEEIRTEINRAIPALAARGGVGKAVTGGIQQAVLRFLDRLADPAAAHDDRAELFRELALHDLRDGPILDVLQTAYRVGARVAWRRLAKVGEDAGVPTETLCVLAEAIFAYIDELSALSAEGHASARAAEIGAVERGRGHLLAAVLGPATSAKALARLAAAARWPLPAWVVAVALDPLDDPAELSTVDIQVLADLDGPRPCLVLAADDRHLLDRLTPGRRAAVGPAVPIGAAADSLRWARRTLALVLAGVLPAAPITCFDQHLSVLWLTQDPVLARDIADRALAPLARVEGRKRTALDETLLAWLRTRRGAAEIAQVLDVHPQTVRYRLRQLDRLFGDRLRDPDQRFDLEVALRVRAIGTIGATGAAGPSSAAGPAGSPACSPTR
ncbi:helix-turn-helix domain-containing protein [Actinokineospora diospyrosa]|uniref:PucR C-terminal helix-turn-helix domain-containing protein n=1 Tax=Actinokineospora diospyrosa TaxID=103728 RepID=A0ABT1INQ6_9PSEU|nr:PucR family transcriptional regulator [Actinokineospora diospyrosa]MCP2274304.1 PucR C-terminal helix-turn-helix domain-containing protein [Actinokineospora diospyrosa]